MKGILTCFLALLIFAVQAQTFQDSIPTVSEVKLNSLADGKIHKLWLKVGEGPFNEPIKIPILVAMGSKKGHVLGLTAALHGNELNGIPIIHEIFDELDVVSLKGILIAVPGLNPVSIFNDQRRFIDREDLNRNFPGKADGNRSQQMAYQIDQKIISLFDFHIDMHTASFGRINSMYARANMDNDTLATMAKLQVPDIILSNKGKPSFGAGSSVTMRASAIARGTHSITVEYGNPQVYQREMIARGKRGILNLMHWLKMTEDAVNMVEPKVVCSKSYWIYTDKGGLLEIPVELNEKVSQRQLIGILKTPFGAVIKKYFAPEDGIVIGKSTNPVTMSGGRIIHLGILKDPEN